MNEYVNIIENMEGFVKNNILVHGPDIKTVTRKAEEIFKQMIRENDETLSEADVQNYLDEGYYEQGDWSINITWPHEQIKA